MSYTLAGGRISQDDDIQFVCQVSPTAFPCQICHKDLSNLNEKQRQVHYDGHFSTDTLSIVDAPSTSSRNEKTTVRRVGTKPGNWVTKLKPTETDVFWFPAQSHPPPPNFSPGLIPVLRKALIACHSKGRTHRAVLCYDRTVHISREYWDMHWGCGYRNFLMACTALMDQQIQPLYFPLLDDPTSPSVRNLQKIIEAAWKDGYDKEGARDMKNELVGTSKWIGTAELYTAFSYRGIPAGLIDFANKDQDRLIKSVTDWIVQYFSPSVVSNAKVSIDVALRGASPVTSTTKMPLILQHNGHSRTIVGYEVSKFGMISLLAFDPSRTVKKRMRNAGLARFSPTSPIHNSQPSTSSSVIQNILQPIHKNKRREVEDTPSHDNRTKRARSTGPKENLSDDEVVIVDGYTSNQVEQKNFEDQLDPIEVFSFFRLDPKKLGRKKEYQILYFPLSEPLSPQEQSSRKEVCSTKIC